MTIGVLELSDRLWRGEIGIDHVLGVPVPAAEAEERAQAEVCGRRAETEASTMAQGVFRWTAAQAAAFTSGE